MSKNSTILQIIRDDGLEVRNTETRIEFRSGDYLLGYYDKAAERWLFLNEINPDDVFEGLP